MNNFRLNTCFQVLLLVFFGFGVYYTALFADINTVDDVKVINRYFNQGAPDLKQIFFPGGKGYYYRPLIKLSFLADKYLWGFQPILMHMENVLLHVINTILVFFLCRKFLFSAGSLTFLPFAAALLFCLHPINTESVNWISGRSDLLVGPFLFSSFLFLLRSLEGKGTYNLLMVVPLFFLATLAKDTAIFWTPAALLLALIYPAEHPSGLVAALRWHNIRRAWLPLASVAIVPVIYFVWRGYAYAQGDSGFKTAAKAVFVSSSGGGYGEKLVVALKAYGFYLKKIVWPFPLNFAIVSISDWYLFLGIAGIVLTFWLLWRLNKGHVLLIMFVCLFSPALLVATGRMAWTPLAERYLYLASAPFSIAVFYVCREFLNRSNPLGLVVQGILLAWLVVFGVGTSLRNHVWQSNVRLFQDTVEKSPEFVPARYELATALRRTGQQGDADKLLGEIANAKDERYSIVTTIVLARNTLKKSDYTGARQVLKARQYSAGDPYYDEYAQLLTLVNSKLIGGMEDSKLKKELIEENLKLILQSIGDTKNSFNAYRYAKILYSYGDYEEAAKYFAYAAQNAPVDAHYRLAAGRLANRSLDEHSSRMTNGNDR